MKNVLDEDLRNVQNINYGTKSFNYFILSVASILILLGVNYFRIGVGESQEILEIIFLLGLFLFLVSSVLGFVYTVLSLVKHEKIKTKKLIGFIGNAIFFVIFVSLIIANLSDLYNWTY